MEKNKTGQYFKYAIGEIVLVVIGILIALQINNWNENQLKIKNEAELLVSLEQEVQGIIEQLEEFKFNNTPFKTASKEVLRKLQLEPITLSSQEISNAFNYNRAVVDSPVLDGIIATNSNLLFKRKDLITDLRNLKNMYSRIEKSEFYMDEFWNSKITDFFFRCGFAIESYSENDPLITLEDIALGGYSKKQFTGLIELKMDLQKYWENRQEEAYQNSKIMLEKLKSE